VQLVKTPVTLGHYISKGFFGSDSLDDDPTEGEVAQCCMVSWVDEWEEVNAKPRNTTQKVDQVTLRSSRQLQPLESVGKKKKEMAPEIPLIVVNSKEKGEDEVITQAQIAKAPQRTGNQLRSQRKIFLS